ncbi:MAG: YciI family protein [Acidimicrobiales bacterium]|jgi:hypothetical protein
MPQYAIFLYAPIDDGHNEPDDGSGREAHDRFSEELQSEGNMIGAFVLESHETATSVRADGITDGPFIEAKEVVLGLYVLEANNLDEALANAQRNPILRQGGGLEVRPIESFVVRPAAG